MITKEEYYNRIILSYPEIRIVEGFTNWKTKIIIESNFGKCAIIPQDLLDGSRPNIRNAVDKNDYFINQLRVVNSFFEKTFILISKYVRNDHHIMLKNKYGLIRMTPEGLLRGTNPSIEGAIDMTDYFKNQFYEKFPTSDILIIGEYKTVNTPLLVKTKFGNCYSAPAHLLEGKTPSIKTAVNKTEYFINKANFIQGFRYLYDYTVYTDDGSNVKVTCVDHGHFSHSATSHLQGIGCYYCGREAATLAAREYPTGWTYEDWMRQAEISKYFESFKCYIIRCWNDNESFYKVGKTFTTIDKRFYGKINMPYNYEVIIKIEGDARTICELETRLKRENKEFKHIPKIEFYGMYECFSQIKDLNLLV